MYTFSGWKVQRSPGSRFYKQQIFFQYTDILISFFSENRMKNFIYKRDGPAEVSRVEKS